MTQLVRVDKETTLMLKLQPSDQRRVRKNLQKNIPQIRKNFLCPYLKTYLQVPFCGVSLKKIEIIHTKNITQVAAVHGLIPAPFACVFFACDCDFCSSSCSVSKTTSRSTERPCTRYFSLQGTFQFHNSTAIVVLCLIEALSRLMLQMTMLNLICGFFLALAALSTRFHFEIHTHTCGTHTHSLTHTRAGHPLGTWFGVLTCVHIHVNWILSFTWGKP